MIRAAFAAIAEWLRMNVVVWGSVGLMLAIGHVLTVGGYHAVIPSFLVPTPKPESVSP